jgi:hypothetical protein
MHKRLIGPTGAATASPYPDDFRTNRNKLINRLRMQA